MGGEHSQAYRWEVIMRDEDFWLQVIAFTAFALFMVVAVVSVVSVLVK